MALPQTFNLIFSTIFIYALVYALLVKIKLFEDNKVNGVLALMAAIITSLTGIVTFSVFYGVRMFAILASVLFFVVVLISFLGVDLKSVSNLKGVKWGIIVVVLLIFLLVFAKSFFALNNSELNGEKKVDTSVNVGVEFPLGIHISSDVWYTFLFLLALGVFVMILK